MTRQPYNFARLLSDLPKLWRDQKKLGEALTEAVVVNPWRSEMVCEVAHHESGFRLVSPGSQPPAHVPRGPAFRGENGGFSISYWNRDNRRPPQEGVPKVLGAWAHFNPNMNDLPSDPEVTPHPPKPHQGTPSRLPVPGHRVHFKVTGNLNGRWEEVEADKGKFN
uniref:Uncharacterized protein n=1 Tax=Palpitomonas bilix TaxID=652834 RepID=A0A7S3CZP2_9EUKA|mmetsp:Transcript_16125/g.40779  ORF Transcript_16125/g.40779 Transcript_16125/m.40779 type:complete len:165 (+) Transcript_16125:55-549(+)|eukprot:CAMPEP_0113878324 /NCGR_PEP_ID=MMETSP0780_2-20120614/6613_1 /TAXON_ID=652834 /ORGANISM="Palpitomonas bilix" /LENGTH=164 /DNA_ID=CAMNT_0000864769 /DNA_START=23 /DNA_END=517 /DNA_ORIENTATION=+ /assembly_acc=CAM_ASM_000599